MDLKGPIVSTQIKIKPTQKLLEYIKNIPFHDDLPENIARIIEGDKFDLSKLKGIPTKVQIQFDKKEISILQEITADNNKNAIDSNKETEEEIKSKGPDVTEKLKSKQTNKKPRNKSKKNNHQNEENTESNDDLPYLIVTDLDWLYGFLQKLKVNSEKDIPYLHELLDGSEILTPENAVLKRNPDLEARCVKLRAQQDARDYRKMTKGVDNVRIWYPEDTIAYQLKQLNRQLIAVGQFLLSIFAGFLFGFKGVELMIGGFDFGFRLLLGVICALVIALAEIYFLAKKLNEEMFVPETTQIGGPPKFSNHPDPQVLHKATPPIETPTKDHQD